MKSTGNKSPAALLRQHAEELLKKKPAKSRSQLSESDILKLIHEIEVYQVELEFQNEELLMARSAALEDVEKYAELYDFAPSAYFTFSKEGQIIELNLFGTKMLGKERMHLKNSRFNFFVSNDSKPTFNLFLESVFKSNIKEFCEVTLSADGNSPIYVYIEGIVTQKGEQCFATVVEITERRRVEEALQESKAKYQAIFDSTGTATLIVEENTTIHMANNECYAITGYIPAELIGQKWIKFVAPESLQEMLKNHQLRRQNPDLAPKKYEVKLISKKEEIRDAILDIGMIPGTKQSIVSILDITDRKRAEEALRESEERLRDIMFSMADWVWEVDENGRYTYSSKVGFDYFGPAPEDVIGKTPFDFMQPDEAKRVSAIFSEIFKKRAPIKNLENRNIRKNGETIYFLTNGVPILDKEGNLKGYRGVDKDITEQMQAQEKILLQLEELKRWQKVMLGREDRVRELKHEVNDLCRLVNEPVRYPSQEGDMS